MRQYRAQSYGPLAMVIRDCACAYRRSVRWEHGKPPTAIIDPLVAELGPAEVLALAEDEQHCVV